ncbi:serine/threonine protein kinase [Methylobacterium sp. BTF04]|uniref:serine/threonine-protein kinase n=1 Tax=Methylobacterium sp. BTF04 TaxID=2708300 RepID=UPI0013D049AE|nr:serine/threonine-protein kinase [Methylobacterium sp. BTF04]NEU11886.1 serine/threonine protein kinase [Methylobacterium sp. BTF04]
MDERTVVETKARIRAGPGTRLNDLYEIDALIAVGGMGEIYRGHVIETGDVVAIKTIRPDFAENANALTLFRKEAAALHNVNHGAVVRYFVFSVDRGLNLPYLAMEYVTGESLADAMKHGPLSFESVDLLRRRLAAGFQAAHEAGIVHRDVSPDNVILPAGDLGRAKIIDFGIARTPLGGQTVIGDGFAGKYSYVSPEQFGLQGGNVTAQSDIYSLGLVLAEASRGRPVDMGANPADFVARRTTIPDLTGVDARLVPLLEAMLRPDPRMRPESMADVAAWEPAPVAIRTAPAATVPRSRRRLAIAAGGLGLVAAAGIALVVLRGPSDDATPSEASTPLAERTQPLAPPAAVPAERAPAAEPPPRDTAAAVSSVRPPPDAEPPPPPRAETAPRPVATPGPAAALDPPSFAPALPPALAPAGPGSPTMEQVAAYIRSYQGGPCFFLNPGSVSPRDAAVEAYGTAPRPFAEFDAAFTKTLGFEARIQLRQIEAAQCPVVELMVRQAQAKPSNVPHLLLDRDRIPSGEELRGRVDLPDDRALRLLLVDGDGLVHDLAPYLKRNGRQASFAVRLETPEPKRGRAQLLVAIASPSPAAALGEGARSDSVFRAIAQEAEQAGSGLGLAVRYLKVGG